LGNNLFFIEIVDLNDIFLRCLVYNRGAMGGVIVLQSMGGKMYSPTDRCYLNAIIKLYPKYKDKAIENYLKMIEKKK
jgi:hypothetical protein